MDRRHFLFGATALAGATLAACGGSTDDADVSASDVVGDDREQALAARSSGSTTPAAAAAPKARVIVVGGGMAGATVAKYLRLWGTGIEVTLIDRAPRYTSCIMSSLVLTGQRTLTSLEYTYDTLRSKYGVLTVFDEVLAIDPAAARVTLASGKVLSADRVILAPGIAFDPIPGLSNPDLMPHAWKAGPQTSLLARQLAAMPSSGVAVMTIPKAPYRCPPGPYERACLLADWMKKAKPRAKLIVLDGNPDFVTERDNFSKAFFDLHGNVIEYRTNVVIDHVDEASKTLFLGNNGGSVRGDVVNLIPTQRAPALLERAGLLTADPSGRFAKVNVLDYSSSVSGAGRVHILGDASATTQPKAGHIANQEAKVCADALSRIFAGGQPDPAPVTNSACFSTITMSQASWLHALFQYDAATASMKPVAAAGAASVGWNGDHFEDMGQWFKALMADTFA